MTRAALRFELAGEDESLSLRGAKPSPAEPRSSIPAAAAEAEPAPTPPAGSATMQPGPGVADYERFLYGQGMATRPTVTVAADTRASSLTFHLLEGPLSSAVQQVWDALADGPKTFMQLLWAVRPEQKALVPDAINVLLERSFLDSRIGSLEEPFTFYSRKEPAS
ncbi:MAG: hypothetical protein KatS3mg005_4142 [Bryobacteraceae bacterium]|nr:MAG: hypothetical protein KatS3mg005_4142 [Bryobacteraceae bacterium]